MRKICICLFLLLSSLGAETLLAGFNLKDYLSKPKESQPNYCVSPDDLSIKKNPHKNIIIVDLGSTGSRMHAYHVQRDKNKESPNAIPKLTEIAIAKSNDKHAIADYCHDHQNQNISEHILPLYKKLDGQLKNLHIEIKEIPIYFYATAGMRLHHAKQQYELYKKIKQVIINSGHNPDMIIAKTIPGELEGIFDWLSINYKLQTIQLNKPTIAALDMGGASTQVAMEYNEKKNKKNSDLKKNLFKLKFDSSEYTIYSNSILGYGLVQTKKNIATYDSKQANKECSIPETGVNTPHEINKTNNFNYFRCGDLIKIYLQNKKEHLTIAKAIKSALKSNMKFVAASGYYYNFNFFNSKLPVDLIKNIPDSCHANHEAFKSKFPNISKAELNEACFDATYLKILLNNGYNMPDDYHNFLIPKHDIDWTIGAALFIATNQVWDG